MEYYKPRPGEIVILDPEMNEPGEWLILFSDVWEKKATSEKPWSGWIGWIRIKNLATMETMMVTSANIVYRVIDYINPDQPMNKLVKRLRLPAAVILRQKSLPEGFLASLTTDELVNIFYSTTRSGNGFDDGLCYQIQQLVTQRGEVIPPRLPQELTDDHMKNVCRPGAMEQTCSFLAGGSLPDTVTCAKCASPELARAIAQKRLLGDMVAQGDNCPGRTGEVPLPTA